MVILIVALTIGAAGSSAATVPFVGYVALMGDHDDDQPRWLPPNPEDQPAGSTPAPGAPGPGEARWGAPAPPPAPGKPVLQPDSGQSGPTESHGKATTSLVLGILGLLVCPWILSILALVFGRKARREIDDSGGRYGNRSVATAGIVLGWIGIVYAIFATIYLVDRLNTPDNDGNGVPDGIDNATILPVLVSGLRVLGVALF